MGEAIRSLAPLGLSAIAILFLYLVYRDSENKLVFGLIVLGCIVFLAVLEKFFPTSPFTDASHNHFGRLGREGPSLKQRFISKKQCARCRSLQ
jgi:hypothetical protein